MKPILIGLCGLKGSGKTTLAQELVKIHNYHRLSFAQPLRDGLRAMGVPDTFLYDHKQTPIPDMGGKDARWLLQTLGTEWGRVLITPDIWVNCLRNRYRRLNENGQRCVIDDVRFDNEAKFITEAGGVVVEVMRGGTQGDGHVSEQGVSPDLVDFKIRNDDSVTDGLRNLESVIL